MKRFLLVAVLVLFGADLAHGQGACESSFNEATLFASQNQWEEANQALGEHDEECAEDARYQYMYGVTLARVSPDSTEKAIAQVTAADSLNGDPGPDDTLQSEIDNTLQALWGQMVNRGVNQLNAGQLDAAQQTLERAVELMPDAKEGHVALAATYRAQEKYDQAVAEYEKALEIDPAYKMAVMGLGETYRLKSEMYAASGDSARIAQATDIAGQSAGVFEEYLEENPDDIDAKIQLAALYTNIGETEKARPIIEEITASEEVGADVLTEFGFNLANAGNNQLAEQLLSRAVAATDSTWSEPLHYLAFVKIQQGELEGARTLLEKQLVLDPSNPKAWEFLGLVRKDLQDPEGARIALEKARTIPLGLQSVTLSQDPDSTWNVDMAFSNRVEQEVQGVPVEVTLVSGEGEAVETQQVTVGAEPMSPGQTDQVRVEFTSKVQNPRVRYEVQSEAGSTGGGTDTGAGS
ncbi:MAG: tetratricopeptide repeat protein [Gemmatimonadota bacterium]|nr:tetratricopeptide repeat protein [Gemmatimonadota bacterium]